MAEKTLELLFDAVKDLTTAVYQMRNEMNEFRQEMRSEMNAFKEEMRSEMNEFRQEVNGRFDSLEEKIDALKSDADFAKIKIFEAEKEIRHLKYGRA